MIVTADLDLPWRPCEIALIHIVFFLFISLSPSVDWVGNFPKRLVLRFKFL